MRYHCLTIRSVLLLCLGLPSLGRSSELPAADLPIETVIDQLIDAQLAEERITPAPAADDAVWLRRVTLDLVGRIPTLVESKRFLESTDPNKRAVVIDRLLASPGYVRHTATELDALLASSNRGRSSLREYLQLALSDNRTWDVIFRELLLADESDPKRKGAAEFLKPRVKDLDRLTNDVSVLFFGVNISCAQCHDHPLVPDWKQDHYYGMKSFFARTMEVGNYIGERDFGIVKFTPNKGKEKQASMMFLTGKVIDAPNSKEPNREEEKKEKEQFEQWKKDKKHPPAPKWSARAALVETALQPDQRDFLARAIVNRTWYRFFGTALVSPMDQLHSENPASHPELLAWLTRDFVTHQYDLKRLTRGILLSKAYGRSSRWQPGEVAPRSNLYAVARVRPLTPMQLATSMKLATLDPMPFQTLVQTTDFEKRIESLESSARNFAALLVYPDEDFQVGVNEALLFSNHSRIESEFLSEGSDRLLHRLNAIPALPEAAELAIRTILCRAPAEAEVNTLVKYLNDRADRKATAWKQIVWALLTSAEFRFNH